MLCDSHHIQMRRVGVRNLLTSGLRGVLIALIYTQAAVANPDITNFKLTRTCESCDFSDADLSLADFSDGNISGSEFSNSNLQGINFESSSVSGNFAGADMRGANFDDAEVAGDPHKCDPWFNVDLRGASFKGATLVDFRANGEFSGANFSGARDSIGVRLQASTPQRRINFSNITVKRNIPFILLDGNFEELNFSNTYARIGRPSMDEYGEFFGLGGACGDEASETSITNSNFESADLSLGVSGYTSSFVNVDLTGSNFSNANLEGVNFDGADLQDVDFTGANLERASFKGARFCNTTAPDGTIMFDGC